MIITTYGENKYKIMLTAEETVKLHQFCKWTHLEHTKALQFLFRYALRHFLTALKD